MDNGKSPENISQYLSTLQYIIHDLERVKSSMNKQDLRFSTSMNTFEMMYSETLIKSASGDSSTSSQKGIPINNSDVIREIEALEQVLVTFLSNYQKLLHTYEEQALIHPIKDFNDKILEFHRPSAIKKIPLFLIHEDIYVLTSLIHYYTGFEYFTVHPFFSVSHLLPEIHPETDGLILISSGIIKVDPSAVLMNIRERTHLMPVLVMHEENEASNMQSYVDTGYNGTIRKECQISDLLDLFLTGLRHQATIHSDVHGG